MDAHVRRRRSLLVAVAGALAGTLVVACAGRSNAPLIGTSDKRPGRSASTLDAGFVDGATALPADYRTTFAKVNKARFVSQGHAAGRWEVDVWANEAAKKALSSRTRDVPVGAIVVAEHFERVPQERGPIMLMEKMPAGYSREHGDWRYAVIGSQGQLVKNGVVESCAGCHDDAPMDGFFPIVE